MTHPRRLAGLLALVVVLTACSSAATAPSSGPPSVTLPIATAPIGTDPNQSTGTIVAPGGGGSNGGGANGGDAEIPKPGQLDVHPVRLDALTASVAGRHVVISANWTSGVEPCNTFDSVIVLTGVTTFALTVREGHGPEQVMCIEIAKLKHALIDLGDLAAGTYTISDSQGGADPIQVTVS